MSGSVNKVVLLGRLGNDPESHTFQDGSKAVSFRMATSETWKDKQTGEKKERAEWHNVSITNQGLAGVAENYLAKGSQVYVEGQLRTREWEKDGIKRYSTDVVLPPFRGELVLLAKAEGGATANRPRHEDEPEQPGSLRAELDDEIPFEMEWR